LQRFRLEQDASGQALVELSKVVEMVAYQSPEEALTAVGIQAAG
jgi:hypothetical protein